MIDVIKRDPWRVRHRLHAGGGDVPVRADAGCTAPCHAVLLPKALEIDLPCGLMTMRQHADLLVQALDEVPVSMEPVRPGDRGGEPLG